MQFGVPAHNPRMQTDIVISLGANGSSGFILIFITTLFALSWNCKPLAWLARPPLGAHHFEEPAPLSHPQRPWLPGNNRRTQEQAGSQGSIQAGQKQGQRPDLFLVLKLEQDYLHLISLTYLKHLTTENIRYCKKEKKNFKNHLMGSS